MTKVKRIKLPSGSYFDCLDIEAVHGDGITNIVSLSEIEYNALANKDANTIYVVKAPQTHGVFGGLEIASGSLAYENGEYVIKDSWNYNSYGSIYGKNNGSTYFNFLEMGQLFEKADFSSSDGDIENLLKPFGDWRLPTKNEWESIIGKNRPGSVVNGQSVHYAAVDVNNVDGILIFPDFAEMSGKEIEWIDIVYEATTLSQAELNNYINQGCIFLPEFGHYSDDHWYDYDGMLLLNDSINTNEHFTYEYDSWGAEQYLSMLKSLSWMSIRLVREASKYILYKGSTAIGDSYSKSEIDAFFETNKEVFFAQYGVTTAKDIYDAYAAGKVVFLNIKGSPFNTYLGESYQWDTYSDWIRTVIPLVDAVYEQDEGYHCDFETFAYGRSTSDDETSYLYRLTASVTSRSWSYGILKPNTISTASQDEIDSLFEGGGGGSSEGGGEQPMIVVLQDFIIEQATSYQEGDTGTFYSSKENPDYDDMGNCKIVDQYNHELRCTKNDWDDEGSRYIDFSFTPESHTEINFHIAWDLGIWEIISIHQD